MTARTISLAVFSLAIINSAIGAAEAKTLAQVNSTVVTEKDLNAALGSYSEEQRKTILRDPNSRSEVLRSVIDRQILIKEAEKVKIDQEVEFKDEMDLTRKQLLVKYLLKKNLSPRLTLEATKKYYENNKDKFSTDQAHVQQILLGDEAEAKKILKMAKDPKNDFQDLAEKYSRDPEAIHNRGDLGWIGRERLLPVFTNAAFSTREGEITGPIHTLYGYHLIKVIKKKIGKPLGFDEVELRVRETLRQEIVRTYVDSLKQTATIEVDRQALKTFNY